MADHGQHFVRREHFGFRMEFFLVFVVVDAGVSRGEDQDGLLLRKLEGERFGNARPFRAEGQCGQLNGGRGNVKFSYAVLHSEGAEVGSAFFNGHGRYSFPVKSDRGHSAAPCRV